MKNWVKVACAGALALVMAACNTIEGMGRDIEKAGDTIEDAASRNK